QFEVSNEVLARGGGEERVVEGGGVGMDGQGGRGEVLEGGTELKGGGGGGGDAEAGLDVGERVICGTGYQPISFRGTGYQPVILLIQLPGQEMPDRLVPRPLPRPVFQTDGVRVAKRIFNAVVQVLLVAHDVIVILRLPKRAA